MTAHKCDRCGKYFDEYQGFTRFRILDHYVAHVLYRTGGGTIYTLELCPKCIKSFKSWFNEFAIGTPEETESEETDA